MEDNRKKLAKLSREEYRSIVAERLRKEYPAGTRVELIRLDDPYRKIPSGTIGTVEFVDDAGQLHTVWEGHGSLAMIYGVDEWRKADTNE